MGQILSESAFLTASHTSLAVLGIAFRRRRSDGRFWNFGKFAAFDLFWSIWTWRFETWIKLDQNGSNLIKLVQIGLKWIKLGHTWPKLIKLVQAGSSWIKLDQTCSNLFKLVQTCSNLFRLVQTCSNLFKLVQTWSNWIKIE